MQHGYIDYRSNANLARRHSHHTCQPHTIEHTLKGSKSKELHPNSNKTHHPPHLTTHLTDNKTPDQKAPVVAPPPCKHGQVQTRGNGKNECYKTVAWNYAQLLNLYHGDKREICGKQ